MSLDDLSPFDICYDEILLLCVLKINWERWKKENSKLDELRISNVSLQYWNSKRISVESYS